MSRLFDKDSICPGCAEIRDHPLVVRWRCGSHCDGSGAFFQSTRCKLRDAHRRIQNAHNLIEQLCHDLNAAHDEILAQAGMDRLDARYRDWPEYSVPANTIREAEKMLGKRLAKTAAWTEFPDEGD